MDKPWCDGCRVVARLRDGLLLPVPYLEAERLTDYEPGMSCAASIANEAIRNMLKQAKQEQSKE